MQEIEYLKGFSSLCWLAPSTREERKDAGILPVGVHWGGGISSWGQFLLSRSLPTHRHPISKFLGICWMVEGYRRGLDERILRRGCKMCDGSFYNARSCLKAIPL
ncbi:hypothetical protein AAC387_Pa12g2160 [Persea americana]